MVHPRLTQKTDNVLTVSSGAKKMFQVVYQEQNKDDKADETPKIKVSSLISKMAFYYEKIRNSVDYKEEHLLRKNAILRILKRLIVIQGAISIHEKKAEDISRDLLTELIRAGYLPNNKIPETKMGEVGKIIEKYAKLRKSARAKGNQNNQDAMNELTNWIISMAACDIEESLERSKIKQMIVSNAYETLKSSIRLADDSPYAKDKNIQIYIGIHRSLLKFDKDMTEFILFKYFISDWKEADDEKIMSVGKNLNSLRTAIEKQIEHPLRKQMELIVNRYMVFFTVLADVITEDPAGVYDSFRADPKAFPRDIKKICKRRYDSSKSRLWRAAVRSIIYIFITKSVLAVALEIPATQWFGEEMNYLAMAINVSFPAFLLFLVVLFAKLPSDENTNAIIEGINELVFEEKKRTEPFHLKKSAKRGGLLNFVFGIFYSITFFFSFGAVIWGLDKVGFNWVSITIFLFFLALVSFFATRIRRHTKELIVIDQRENIVSFLVDFFYMPVIAVGKWLSEKFSKINVFVFVLDFIIEAPFKIFVQIAEEWTKYVKERKDEIM